jgi:hypothetical protein
MKLKSVLPSAAFALVIAAGLAPASADAACYGHDCVVHHHAVVTHRPAVVVTHRHVNVYSGADYRQWREYGGTRAEW